MRPNIIILVVNNLEFGTEFSHKKEKYSFCLNSFPVYMAGTEPWLEIGKLV